MGIEKNTIFVDGSVADVEAVNVDLAFARPMAAAPNLEIASSGLGSLAAGGNSQVAPFILFYLLIIIKLNALDSTNKWPEVGSRLESPVDPNMTG